MATVFFFLLVKHTYVVIYICTLCFIRAGIKYYFYSYHFRYPDHQNAPSSRQTQSSSRGGHQSRTPAPQLGQRERSTSAPNVCANMVEAGDMSQLVSGVLCCLKFCHWKLYKNILSIEYRVIIHLLMSDFFFVTASLLSKLEIIISLCVLIPVSPQATY